jgi:hypothetical protein
MKECCYIQGLRDYLAEINRKRPKKDKKDPNPIKQNKWAAFITGMTPYKGIRQYWIDAAKSEKQTATCIDRAKAERMLYAVNHLGKMYDMNPLPESNIICNK